MELWVIIESITLILCAVKLAAYREKSIRSEIAIEALAYYMLAKGYRRPTEQELETCINCAVKQRLHPEQKEKSKWKN